MIWILLLAGVYFILKSSKTNTVFPDNVDFPPSIDRWKDLAKENGDSEKVPYQFILAIIWNESTGDPNATNPHDPSYGLMAITNGAAKDVNETLSNWNSPEDNIRIGTKYLAKLYYVYMLGLADWYDVAVAYNWGVGNWRKWKSGIRQLPDSVKLYADRATLRAQFGINA